MSYCFLSGGTGTPKLLQGFRSLLEDTGITVICNSGDDYTWNGLYICPDLDTILYLFSNKLDLNKFWGVTNESFDALETLRSLSADDTWFNVGDKDLGLHIYRTNRLKNHNLTQITKEICLKWGINAGIYPMSNNPVQTLIHDKDTPYKFQEYFVKMKTQVDVSNVEYSGNKELTSRETVTSLKSARKIIIGPSNPVTSIGPIFAIKQINNMIKKYNNKVIAISPIISNRAFSGPTTKLMQSMGISPDIKGLANYYEGYISQLFLDESDRDYKSLLLDHNIEPIFCSIEMSTLDQKKKLAQTILDFI